VRDRLSGGLRLEEAVAHAGEGGGHRGGDQEGTDIVGPSPEVRRLPKLALEAEPSSMPRRAPEPAFEASS
jgi:hypothetical protein